MASWSLPGFAQTVELNELVANNDFGLRDANGGFPDWIELYNPGTDNISLEGWFLTDAPTELSKWRFPAVTLSAKGFLVVFCSGKDLRDPGSKLHTNFKLASSGEFIAIVRPDGTVEDQIAPFFPALAPGVSYGRRQEVIREELLPLGADARYLVPRDDALGETWRAANFDDASWRSGASGIGFDTKSIPTFLDLIATDVGGIMRGVNASMFLRMTFEIEDLDAIDILKLRIHFESGFVAFVNGVEIARDSAPQNLQYDSRATSSRARADVLRGNDFVIADDRNTLHLQNGRNVLAIQGLNNGLSSSDFVVLAGLESLTVQNSGSRILEFFETPTPGLPNGTGAPEIAASPIASRASGLVSQPFELELTSPESGQIRFTRDGGIVGADAELYTDPILIDTTTRIRTRAFVPGRVSSPVVTYSYPMLEPAAADFNSDLPILVVETFGRSIGDEPKIPGYVFVTDVDPETGRSDLLGEGLYSGPMGIEARGSSTIGRVKKSYSLEIQDQNGDDLDVELLGMPENSDWVLYGPLNFDRAMLRNPFVYRLSNQIGLYALRTQFVEIFVNLDSSLINRSSDYYGVYVFMEKNKRGPHRVDVEKLLPSAREEPEITGGYMLKIDRPDPRDDGFSAAREQIQYVYPKEEDISGHQAAWIEGYFNDFGDALFGPNYRDPIEGYARYVDVDSWIDFYLLNEFTKNPDAFVLSTYFYKPRSERIFMGVVWDFDRTMGNDDDPRALNPIGWGGRPGWWGRLFADPDFESRYKRRWRELRSGPMSTTNMHALLDSMADEIRQAQVRNFQRWTGLVSPNGGWENEVRQLKDWIKRRAEWLDIQLFEPPAVEPAGGLVEMPIDVRISDPAVVGAIYYTLNGPDPKQPDGQVHPTAVLHDDQPLVINEVTRLRARIRRSAAIWSEVTERVYYDRLPSIAMTEVMYNPTNGRDFEYIEFYNYGDEPVLMHGSGMTQGVILDDIQEGPEFLAPGDYTVVVRSREDFASRYAVTEIHVSGEYTGVLSDTGERLVFHGSLGQSLVDFRYSDAWYPETDGRGHSLVLIDPTTPPEEYEDPARWRASAFPDGSPGVEDPTEFPIGGQIPADSNQDGRFNLSDALHLVNTLFHDTGDGFPCADGRATDTANLFLLDSNSDLKIDGSDVIDNLMYLFLDGPPPQKGTACVGVPDCPDVCDSGT